MFQNKFEMPAFGLKLDRFIQKINFFMLHFRANLIPLFILQLFEFTKQNFRYLAVKLTQVFENISQSAINSSSLNQKRVFQTNFEPILFD